jgi:molybdopterin synthase catalytic subunit
MPVPQLAPPPGDDTWIGLSPEALPVGTAADWVVQPHCGATVVFTGTARDHAPGRPGVQLLRYEAYEGHAEAGLAAVAGAVRDRWPTVGRIALLHRTGPVGIGEAAVVVAVSAPHRGEAFEAGRFAIDELKATVPIWKKETWEGGDSWGLEAQHATAGPSGGPG